MDDYKRRAEIDAFQASEMSGTRCLLLLTIVLALFLLVDFIDRTGEKATQQVAKPSGADVNLPAAVAPLQHPLCAEREQWVKQWGGGKAVHACVNADLRR